MLRAIRDKYFAASEGIRNRDHTSEQVWCCEKELHEGPAQATEDAQVRLNSLYGAEKPGS